MEKDRMENLDRILASEESLLPSSGFVAAVMERVREEAIAPKPITFPWKRVLPAMLIVAAALTWCMVQLLHMAVATPPNLSGVHLNALEAQAAKSAGWAIAALTVSLLSWILARRMVGRDSLV